MFKQAVSLRIDIYGVDQSAFADNHISIVQTGLSRTSRTPIPIPQFKFKKSVSVSSYQILVVSVCKHMDTSRVRC